FNLASSLEQTGDLRGSLAEWLRIHALAPARADVVDHAERVARQAGDSPAVARLLEWRVANQPAQAGVVRQAVAALLALSDQERPDRLSVAETLVLGAQARSCLPPWETWLLLARVRAARGDARGVRAALELARAALPEDQAQRAAAEAGVAELAAAWPAGSADSRPMSR
ncbi:MAG: hypothetical protein IT458_03585, partial [Planctomycetes bacterium]|nr:hypothetical protein [Planctomycetota bacterium]